MSKRITSLFLVAVALIIFSGCASDDNTRSFTTPTGTGHLRKSDTIWILNLEGSYTDMGRQYGALLKNELNDLFTRMDKTINYSSDNTTKQLQLIGKKMAPREQQLLNGMAMESGLDFNKHEFLNASLFFMYGGCSAFAATGDQTEGGFTIAGRNFDNPLGPGGVFAGNLRGTSILVIYNPRDQYGDTPTHRDNQVAIMTQMGWVYGLTNLNSKGIYIEYNNGMNSIPMKKEDLPALLSTYMDGLHQNLYASFDSDTLDDVNTKLSGPAAIANMTQVADKNRIWHYERSPYQNSRKIAAGEAKGAYYYDNPANMDIITNHFFFDNWSNQQVIYTSPNKDSGSRTFARLVNLQKLARQYSGKLNAETMKIVMTTHLLKDGTGGPFIGWELDNPDVTHFTTVTDIAKNTIYIYPYLDGTAVSWTAVDLTKEFK